MIATTSPVFCTVMRAWRNAKVCPKTLKNVVGIGEQDDSHGPRSPQKSGRQSSAAVAAQEDGILHGVTVIDEHVVIGALGVHLGEREGDVVTLIVP